jgi:hypothetical protein
MTSHQTTPGEFPRDLQAKVFNVQLVKAQPSSESQCCNEAQSHHHPEEKVRHAGMAGHPLGVCIRQQKGSNTWFTLATTRG